MGPSSPPLRWWEKFSLWFKYSGHVAVGAVGAIGLAFGPAVPGVWIPGLALTFAATIWNALSGPKLSQLVADKRTAELRAQSRSDRLISLLDVVIESIAKGLGLDMSDTRISVYRHTKEAFWLVGRHCDSPSLKAAGRPSYRDTEGLIGKAWHTSENGGAIAIGLPKDRALWEAKCARDYGMPTGVVKGLKMQSRSMIGMRLGDGLTRQSSIGVILIECLRPNGLTGAHKDNLVQYSPTLLGILTLIIDELDANDALPVEAQRAALTTTAE